MITLRPYQADGETNIRRAFASGYKAPLYVLPTGAGKTITFASIAQSAQRRGKRVLILAHRVELVDQIVTALHEFEVEPEIIAAGYNARRTSGRNRENHPVAVASVQTLIRRLDDYPAPTLIIVDEAHHCAGMGNTWSAILRYYSTAKVLGTTATPIRLDGRGLRTQFDHLIVGPSVAELTAQGYLVPARIFAPPTVDTSRLRVRAGDYRHEDAESLMDVPMITGDALAHYRKHADNLPALVFSTSVAHAHHVAEHFAAAGIAAVALNGGTQKEIRREVVRDFRDGKIRVLVSCDLFSEGFDVPGAHVGILLRPTASMGLFLQQVGRLLRPAPGKTRATLLDHVGNTQRHGLPNEPRNWVLTEDMIKKKKPDAFMIRICPKCFAATPGRATQCVECGLVFEVKSRKVEQKDGELVELTAEEIARKRARREQGRSRTLAELEQFAKMKGYNPLWAIRVWEARQRKKETA